MKALTVEPGNAGSLRLDDLPEPLVTEGAVLVEAVALGVCGTDIEIIDGEYGMPPMPCSGLAATCQVGSVPRISVPRSLSPGSARRST